MVAGYWPGANGCRLEREDTYRGLYEFNNYIMPFGWKNAPAVFQRLMDRESLDLNPEEGPAIVSVYIDDMVIFSRTFEEHLKAEAPRKAGIKLKPFKCHSVQTN